MKLILASIVVLTFSSVVFACGSLETELGVFEYQPSFTSFLGDDLALPEEKRLKNIKQLSFGGENAEAYFSFDGKQLIFQSKRDGRGCDQIYTMNVDG